jgi:putative restriction endonuclease
VASATSCPNENLPATDAWNKFGRGNGVRDREDLVKRLTGFAQRRSASYKPTDDPIIGCIALDRTVFLGMDDLVEPSDVGIDFAPEVVKIKYFDSADPSLGGPAIPLPSRFQLQNDKSIETQLSSRKRRIGQAEFRDCVLSVYGHQCAFTGVSVPEVLEAAHIQPYINELSNHVQNGLALRKDLHALFDAGLIAVDNRFQIEISPLLKSNAYQSLHGQTILVPKDVRQHPSTEALLYHRKWCFRTVPA